MATRGQGGSAVLWDRNSRDQQELVCNNIQFKDILNSHRVALCEMVHLDSIWPSLRQLHVISVNEEENIKFGATRSDMVGKLIDHINRGPMWRMHAFLRACVVSDYIYILDVLEVDSGQYKDTDLLSTPYQPDLSMEPGDTMETSSVASYLPDLRVEPADTMETSSVASYLPDLSMEPGDTMETSSVASYLPDLRVEPADTMETSSVASYLPDLSMEPADTMETSSVASSSYPYQDDTDANRIRLKLIQPSSLLIDSLAEKLEMPDAQPLGTSRVDIVVQLLPVLLLALVINSVEADQIKRIQGGQQRASYLVGVIRKKAGTELKIFVDILKTHCPSAYRAFETGGSSSSSSNSPKKYKQESVSTHTNGNPTQASTLLACMTDTHYGGFKFFSNLKAVINSGMDVTLLTFESGLNLLQEAIRLGRLELFLLIQYTGLWTGLYDRKSGHGAGAFSNLTPQEYANKLGAKGKAAKDKLAEINEHECLLQDVDRCAREGNVRRFRELKARFKDHILKSSHRESSVLEYACQSGVLEMLQEVIRTEKELGIRRRSVDKAVAVCVTLSHHTFLQPLMEYVKVDLNQIRLDGRTPIEYTAVNGDVDTFNVLKRLGAQVAPAVVALAAAKNRLPFLKSILSTAVLPLKDINFQDKRGKTAAHFAAEKGHVNVLRLLLERSLNLTLRDKRKFSILHSACSGGFLDVVEVVLEFSRCQNYLHTILTTKDHYIGADRCYCVKGNDGSNPAWHYVKVDRALIEVFKKKMAEGGINVTTYGEILQSGWGEGPSAEVVKEIEGQYDVVNADTSTINDDMQPLHLAILKNHEGVALRLIKEMGDVNQQDHFGLTPLHLAAMRGSLPVIKALLRTGANIEALDKQGRTPFDVAEANEKQEAIHLLRPADGSQQLQNIRRKLKDAFHNLSTENLAQQGNPQQYTKCVLRDVEADIKDYLYDCLGEGLIDAESLEPW